jgi:glutamine synthetase
MSKLVANIIGRRPKNLQRSDLLNFIKEHELKRITFHYTAGDGRLKELILPINSMDYAERVLAAGERVDGSSLFKGMVGTASSDLYVVPVYATAFINPFDSKSINFICRFLNKNEELAEFCPDNILKHASDTLFKTHGFELWALGELEFYLIGKQEHDQYPMEFQSGYHTSAPYSRYMDIVKEMLEHISDITGKVKYGHSEVGVIHNIVSEDLTVNGKYAEQFEIEFLPAPIESAADYMTLAKWVVRNVAYKYDLLATFAPKIEEGYAGTGLHFHLELLENNKNIMTKDNGDLSDISKKAIGGLLKFAPSLTAFGNTVASSYLRLVPNQESPTKLFWSDLNRSALVRVPLGWKKSEDMASKINHRLKDIYKSPFKRQTIELRSADGSAFIHLLLGGITIAIQWGLDSPDDALVISKKCYVNKSAHSKIKDLASLPPSCAISANLLQENMYLYEKQIPKNILEWVILKLKAQNDETLISEIESMEQKDKALRRRSLMHKVLHIG